MNYEFPIINNISDVLPAIKGRDEFVVAVKEGYTVINYNVMMADTFPPVKSARADIESGWKIGELSMLMSYDKSAAIRRECRGIIFDTESGEILRRPYHKFFNVNEREETQDHVVDLSRDHAILEKLDGSMIAPFIVNGEMIWGTKMGATDVAKPVEEFIARNPQYIEFANNSLNGDVLWTPIFEWCSRKQRIVLDYAEDRLILTAMRNLTTGTYASYAQLVNAGGFYNIPVVRAFEPQSDMKAFIEYVRGLEDLEGFVVRFDDGHMLKLKCDWYVQIHKAKEKILQDRNIVELILDGKLDDVMAHLPKEDRDRLIVFESQFNLAYADVVYMLANDLDWIREEKIDRKTFALEHAKTYRDPYIPTLIFRNFDVVDHVEYWTSVDDTIRKNLTKTVKYEAIRDAWFPGVKYNA